MTDTSLRIAEILQSASHVIALTGAGMSTESGIPDFRSPTGVWQKVDPMEVASLGVFMSDPARYWAFHRPRVDMLSGVEPNDGHRALAELERRGILKALITQNIDRLHSKAGSREVIEVHGSLDRGVCLRCDARISLDELLARADAAEDGVPRCTGCGFQMKSGVVMFGEPLPQDAIAAAHDHAMRADVVLVAGSSLAVTPVNQIPGMVVDRGGALVILTESETPYDRLAAVRSHGRLGTELPAVVAALDGLG